MITASQQTSAARPVLEIRGLTASVSTQRGAFLVLNGVSLAVNAGETVGLVGESGSGKTMTGLAIMGLLPRSTRVTGGQILFDGQDLLTRSSSEMARLRGSQISMVLQDPMTALDPVLRLRTQMIETPVAEDRVDTKTALRMATEWLRKFRVGDQATRLQNHPHELSGGMRQRVVSAIAISRRPKILIADEPTTALDATLQLQYLRLMKEVQADTGVAIIFITHDMGIVRSMCDRVAVMYGGRIVETGRTDTVLSNPDHPYTEGLLNAIASPTERVDFLPTIPGEPPNLERLPPGCAFEPRCPYAFARCAEEFPPEITTDKGTLVRCWKHVPDA